MRIEFDFVLLVHIGGQPQTEAAKNPWWDLSHTELKGSKEYEVLEALCVKASAKKVSLHIDLLCIVDYSPDKITDGLQIEADIYYILLKTNQVGINFFIQHNNHLYLLQMTVSDAASRTNSGLSPDPLKGLPKQHSWHSV